MTFKHIKFSDSETMQSLTKVALDKGMITSESSIEKTVRKYKTGPKSVDLKISSSFDENLIKLCAGLRAEGFDKYAELLETKYVHFKMAGVLEDAHPAGSVEVAKSKDGHGVVEDLNDVHEAMEAVARKPATGKQASFKKKEVIASVASALGEDFLLFARAVDVDGAAGAVGGAVATGVAMKAAPAAARAVSQAVGRAAGAASSSAIELGSGYGSSTSVATSAATRAPVAWGRLLSMLGHGARAAGGAATGAVGGLGGVAVGGGTVAAAALAGAVAGYFIGDALFDKILAPKDIQNAGKSIIDNGKDLVKEFGSSDRGSGTQAFTDFQSSFSDVVLNLNAAQKAKEALSSGDPSLVESTIENLKKLYGSAWKSHKHALELWGWAKDANDRAGTLRFFTASNIRDFVALCKNYMDRINVITSGIDELFNLMIKRVEEKNKLELSKNKSNGTEDQLKLEADFLKIESRINGKLMTIKNNKNAISYLKGLLSWLNSEKKEYDEVKLKFSTVPADDVRKVISSYRASLAKVDADLNLMKEVG